MIIHTKFFSLLIISFLFWITVDSYAQPNYQERFYNAFIDDKLNMWGDVITEYEHNKECETIEEKLELINLYYANIGYLLGIKDKENGDLLLRKCEKLVQQVLDEDEENAAALAYMGAICGWRVSLDHSTAPVLGPKMLLLVNRAYKNDSLNVQAIVDKANFYFYAPGFIGGDPLKAARLYAKAVYLMEQNNKANNNWQYLNTIILLAKAYVKAEDLSKAKSVYLKILQKEPDFIMIKEDLLPKLLRQMKRP